jgi:hypothetical protein
MSTIIASEVRSIMLFNSRTNKKGWTEAESIHSTTILRRFQAFEKLLNRHVLGALWANETKSFQLPGAL